jgi:hypothetical protein
MRSHTGPKSFVEKRFAQDYNSCPARVYGYIRYF